MSVADEEESVAAARRYYRVSLGPRGAHAAQALEEGWIGVGWMAGTDLTGRFPDDWREFNREFVPLLLASGESTSPIAAGLGCGATWTVGRGINVGDIVLSSTGAAEYQVGRVAGGYEWAEGEVLPHRRPIEWLPQRIPYSSRSADLARATRAIGTLQTLDAFGAEIETLLVGSTTPAPIDSDAVVVDRSEFEFEKHLEDFLAKNWAKTEFGAEWSLLTDEHGALIGRQYLTDTGPLDLLAVNKTGTEYLVVELKRGRASDVVVGQILRYMGYLRELDPTKGVKGLIIGLEDDLRLRRALEMVPSVRFRRYEIEFRLH